MKMVGLYPGQKETTAKRSCHQLFASTWPLCAVIIIREMYQLRHISRARQHTGIHAQICEETNEACDGENQNSVHTPENNPNTKAKQQSLSKGPSIFIWLTGESECVTGSDEKCIWASSLMRAGSGR